MRTTISIKGARENNLQNIDIEIPRDKLTVLTGISGSGKSSLAFDTVYAESQRRFMESLSTYAKRFMAHLKKPDVDFMTGLSPVISIEQKTISMNPRSTVGTMTDLGDYLRMLYATIGQSHCPYCQNLVSTKSKYQIVERMLSLPNGTEVQIRAPIFKIHGEDYAYLFDQIRTNGYRYVLLDGQQNIDLAEEHDLDEDRDYKLDVIIDRFVIQQGIEKQILATLEHGLVIGEGFLSFHLYKNGKEILKNQQFYTDFGCPEHRIIMGTVEASYFTFNEPTSACHTCSGLGTYLQVHPILLTPDTRRSIRGGAFVPGVFVYDPDRWDGRIMYSLSQKYDFDLDEPYQNLSDETKDLLLYGTKGDKLVISIPDDAKTGERYEGHEVRFDGFANRLDRRYRHYRKEGTSHSGMEDYLRRVMVEHTCPDCNGTRLKRQRLLITINNHNIHRLGTMHLQDLQQFLSKIEIHDPKVEEAGRRLVQELSVRLELLNGIGLEYLNLNRRSGTLSGGESQRIRLSTQIGSGLMGMLYVLDEPSIGLHPRDNAKMIGTLKQLRDVGNTVIVVEHDEETIQAADHIIEIGPGAGVHGGQIVAEGQLKEIIADKKSLTGQFLSGVRKVDLPDTRRQQNQDFLSIRGARENNLQNIDVDIPLGMLVCITGVSGSGKSTLTNQIIYKKLYSIYHDSRTLSGDHDHLDGYQHISDVINIDQNPIGRSPRSNPATYIGFYDNIRKIFANTPSAQARGYTPSRFSFNVKGGRCEECSGEGTITTQLYFMPDVEVTCPTCKGRRYNEETLEITYEGKTIADILEMSIEEGVLFFSHHSLIARKLGVLNDLGLGYLTIGHPATILSGGEAQRIKLATELGKIKRGKHNLYMLDEPTTGLHLADIQRLLDSLNQLVDQGHTIIVVEHHLDVIKSADYVIDLGPEGGHKGGSVVAYGTPEEVSRVKNSFTGRFLKKHLNS